MNVVFIILPANATEVLRSRGAGDIAAAAVVGGTAAATTGLGLATIGTVFSGLFQRHGRQ